VKLYENVQVEITEKLLIFALMKINGMFEKINWSIPLRYASNSGGLEFKSRSGQIIYNVTNGSLYFNIYTTSCVALALCGRDGPMRREVRNHILLHRRFCEGGWFTLA